MGMFGGEKGPQGPMSRREVQRYVDRNGVLVPEISSDVQCIDGRQTTRGVGAPGGGLGIATTLFSALDSGARGIVGGFTGLAGSVENMLGGMTAHTDGHNADHSFPCAGCGHINSIRNNPDAYGFSGDHLGELDDYSHKIKGNNFLAVLFGPHKERAVLDVHDPFDQHISIPPSDGTDDMFVFNRGATKSLLGKFIDSLSGKHGDVWAEDPRDVLDKHAELTVGALAPHLPVYKVGHNGKKIHVE